MGAGMVPHESCSSAITHLYSSRPSVVAAAQLRPVGASATWRVRMMGACFPPAPGLGWGPQSAVRFQLPSLLQLRSAVQSSVASIPWPLQARRLPARTCAGQVALAGGAARQCGRQQVVIIAVLVLDLVQGARIRHVPAP